MLPEAKLLSTQQKQLRRKATRKYAPIAGLKAGEPLPDKGACTHYRHSYRWLR